MLHSVSGKEEEGRFTAGQGSHVASSPVTRPVPATPAHLQNEKVVRESVFSMTVINPSYS